MFRYMAAILRKLQNKGIYLTFIFLCSVIPYGWQPCAETCGSSTLEHCILLLAFLRGYAGGNELSGSINLIKPTGHVMHQQFNIQQLYALPTLYLCVLYLSENKQRLVPLTA